MENLEKKNKALKLIAGSLAFLLIVSVLYFTTNTAKKLTNNNGVEKTFTKEAIKNTLAEVMLPPELKDKLTIDGITKDNISNLWKINVSAKINGEKEEKQELFTNNNGKVFYVKAFDVEEIKKTKKENQDNLEKTQKEIEERNKRLEKEQKEKYEKNKPEVQLFVMSYCPFGTQAEKGYLPAVEKLGDKIDAKIKFVNYVMHPQQGEGEENLLQYCIQKETPKKFNSYLKCFLGSGKTDTCLKENNISKDSLKSCIDKTDTEFKITENNKDKSKWLSGRYPKFLVQDDLNKKYGVQGSPTLVINGKKIDGVGRDANSMFKAICSSFKTQPEVCKEELSKENPKSGFGYGKAQATGQQAQGGCGA